MSNANGRGGGRSGWWLVLIPVALVLWTTATASGRTLRHRFFAALRIARPEAVSVNVPAFSGPTGSRRLQDAIASMLASRARVTREAADSAVPDSAAAARLAGFAPHLVAGRADKPSFAVQTPRSMTLTVDRGQLQTVMSEVGQSSGAVPAGVDGQTLTIDTPAAVIASYGHCPVVEGQTLTNQIAQRPPPTAESSDCVILEQRPVVSAQAPPGLDMAQLTGIALEVAGMSPIQMAAFQRAFSWAAALALTMPRFMRSYDTLSVNGAPAMLINTLFRRGPTYQLLWSAGGRVYVLTGYGNSADAAGLARTVGPASVGGRP
ncbi:MAG: hypothetical protein KGO03_05195 [Gemmatimonadota bacterium]|nr:hypothetical protein [Gemmatimonadota bacterium]